MQAVVEIISALERTSITEELLKTTRLGKYINELRKKTSNEILAKRAKELLKKWRDQVIPSTQSNQQQQQQQHHQQQHQRNSMTITTTTIPAANGTIQAAAPTSKQSKQHQNLIAYSQNDRSNSPDLNLNRTNNTTINHKKRPLSTISIDDSSNGRKRIKMNGRHHHHHHNISSNDKIYISDNSNSSPTIRKLQHNSTASALIVSLNSNSNSSFSDHHHRVPPTTTTTTLRGSSDGSGTIKDTNLTFSGRNLNSSLLHNDTSSTSSSRTRTPPTPAPSVPAAAAAHIKTASPLPPILQKPEPKKRGRKKGSKNHKTLLVQAEESFTNKMAVSVNSKVKTTQELLASIQNKTNLVRQPSSAIEITKKVISPKIYNSSSSGAGGSPKLTITTTTNHHGDKKLTTTIIGAGGGGEHHRNRSNHRTQSPSVVLQLQQQQQQRTASPKLENKLLTKLKERSDSPIKIDLVDSENSRSSYQDSSVVCITREGTSDDGESEIIDLEVHDDDEDVQHKKNVLEDNVKVEPSAAEETHKVDNATRTVEEILAQLPKIDYSVLYETEDDDPQPMCTCPTVQPAPPAPGAHNITVEFHHEDGGTNGDNNERSSSSCISYTKQSGAAGGGSIFDVPDDSSSETRTNIVKIDNIINSRSNNSDDEDGDQDQSSAAATAAAAYDVSTCPAKRYLDIKYRLTGSGDDGSGASILMPHDDDDGHRVDRLHSCFLDSINGNRCDKTVNQRYCDVYSSGNSASVVVVGGGGGEQQLYSNIVPNFHNGEIIKKDISLESINYIKYKQIIPYPFLSNNNNDSNRGSSAVVDGDGGENDERTTETHCTTTTTTTEPSRRRRSSQCCDDDDDDDKVVVVKDDEPLLSPPPRSLAVVVAADDQQSSSLSHDNFREFHECVSLRSYNDELLHILPYVVLD